MRRVAKEWFLAVSVYAGSNRVLPLYFSEAHPHWRSARVITLGSAWKNATNRPMRKAIALPCWRSSPVERKVIEVAPPKIYGASEHPRSWLTGGFWRHLAGTCVPLPPAHARAAFKQLPTVLPPSFSRRVARIAS